jgi:hypothetical protein
MLCLTKALAELRTDLLPSGSTRCQIAGFFIEDFELCFLIPESWLDITENRFV